MAQPESRLSRQIMDALRARGIFCFKVHGGPTMMAGLPDIIACVPVPISEAVPDGIGLACEDRWVGQFVGFETKMPSGGNPTPIQMRIHENIAGVAGIVFVIRRVDDVDDMLAYVGWVQPAYEPRGLDKASLWHRWRPSNPHRAIRSPG